LTTYQSVSLSAKKKKDVNDENNDNDTAGTNSNSSPPMNAAKKAALDGVLQQIERNYGRGSIMKIG
jgi:hypothetical protein